MPAMEIAGADFSAGDPGTSRTSAPEMLTKGRRSCVSTGASEPAVRIFASAGPCAKSIASIVLSLGLAEKPK
jgi:hypothetical protein